MVENIFYNKKRVWFEYFLFKEKSWSRNFNIFFHLLKNLQETPKLLNQKGVI